jgi:uncharacterized membrane protein
MNSLLDNSYNEIFEHLKNLEKRIARLETRLNIEKTEESEESSLQERSAINNFQTDSLEFRIGQYWFAKGGIIFLAIGIILLLTFPYPNLPAAFPSLIGYLLVAAIFFLSGYWRKNFSYISGFMFGSGMVLLYFTTMRLYFFSEKPALENRTIEIILLLLVTAIHLFFSIKRKSIYLTGIGLLLSYLTSVLIGQTYIIFILLVLLSSFSVFLKIKYRWDNLLLSTYFSHFIWALNNPLMGNKIQIVNSPVINLIFILIYAVTFSSGNLINEQNKSEDYKARTLTFLNCLGSYGIFLIISFTGFRNNFAEYNLIASLVYLSISIVYWIKIKSKHSTFFYAILGYLALSASIVAAFPKPEFFILLCWQSLLVISTAIWFRSKFIIVSNFIIYLLIFFTYLFLAEKVSTEILSFGIVALLSARIMNWQKNRLELKTELMRNSYLIAAFFIFPYSLYHLMPGNYVSLSWVSVAIIYYLISHILKNNKYRWMALGTLLLSIMYLFFIGITKLEPTYRIISFLVLGIVLLVVSLFYARYKAKNNPDEEKK